MVREFQGDPYRVLGLARGASAADVKRAYRKLAKLRHPDVDPSPGAARAMVQINAAYELLRDADRRARWDARHPEVTESSRKGSGGPKAAPSGGAGPGSPAAGTAGGPRRPPRPGGAAGRPNRNEPGRRPPPSGPPRPEPTLDEAFAYVITFGKFRGRSLGYIAEAEPGYLRWIDRTIRDRPELLRYVKVIVAHLDRQAAEGRARHGDSQGAAGGTGGPRPSSSGAAAPTSTPPRPATPARPPEEVRPPVGHARAPQRRRARAAVVLSAAAVLAAVGFAAVRLPAQPAAQPMTAATASAPGPASAVPTTSPVPTAPPSASATAATTPTPKPTPAPTPFRPNSVRKVTDKVVAGINFAGNLEPYTLVLNGPKSLEMVDLEYIGFIQYDVRLSATAQRSDDCRFAAWQESEEFDPATGKGTWIEEARWDLAPGRGQTSAAHEPKFIVLGLGRRLHVRTDCTSWTIKIRGVDLGHGKVPGAPKWWDGLEDLDCADFGSSETATTFLSYFGEKGSMLYELDGDGDGIACDAW